MHEIPRSAEIIIIGAGFAGLSTAYHLTRMGMQDVVILERESTPGAHASGRNAALLRRIAGHDPFGRLCVTGADRILERSTTSRHLKHHCGSLLLCNAKDRSRLEQIVEKVDSPGTPCRWLDRGEASSQVPILEEALFDSALRCPQDGIVDLQNLLQFYLSEAQTRGARLFTSMPVDEVLTKQSRVCGVRTPSGTVRTELVVNAAGAWASPVASSAGAIPTPLQPHRRHLFRLAPGPTVTENLPWFWNLSASFYLRPDTDGWIASYCDEDPHPPRDPHVDPNAELHLARVLRKHLPRATSWSVERSWACLRTFSADRQPLIGPDPKITGFYWIAGLGGNGVTTSDIVGELTARTILGQRLEPPYRSFAPERFLQP